MMCIIGTSRATFVDDTRVQLDGDGSSDNFTEEAARISRVTGGFGCWAFTVGGHGDEGGGDAEFSSKQSATYYDASR